MTLTILFLLIQIVLLFISLRRFGLLPVPTFVIIFIMISQLLYGLAHDGIIIDEFWYLYEINGLYNGFVFTQLIYTLISISVLMCFVFFDTRELRVESFNFATQSLNILSQKYGLIAILFLLIQLALLSLFLRWDIIAHNTEYLLMTDPQYVIDGPPIVRSLFSSISYVGPLSAGLAALYYIARKYVVFFGLAFIATFYFLYLLSAHSRSAAEVPLAFAAILWMAGRKQRKRWIASMFAIAIASIISGLAGRNTASQGFYSLPEIVPNIIDYFDDFRIAEFLENFCEGIFVTGEGLQIREAHSTLYKILSLSPVPSVIDGFSQLREAQEIRLHEFVPMSGISELYLFGFPYNLFGIVIFIYSIYLVQRLRAIDRTMFMTCNVLQFFALYLVNSYPLRNALKPLWLLYLFAAISFAVRLRAAHQQNPIRRI